MCPSENLALSQFSNLKKSGFLDVMHLEREDGWRYSNYSALRL